MDELSSVWSRVARIPSRDCMSHTPAAFLPSISITSRLIMMVQCHFNAILDKQEASRSQAETLLRVSQFEIFSFLTLEKLQSGA